MAKAVGLSTQARLAQAVEHGTLNPRVVGSSPTLEDLSLLRFPFVSFTPG